MLSGLLAGQSFVSVIDGDSSLRRRPMGRIMEPLGQMGARISAREGKLAPIEIAGGPLKPVHYSSPVASAQVKTCILFAGLYACGTTTVTEPARSRNHTELMLPEFGASVVSSAGLEVGVEGGRELEPVDYIVPGDISSAAFFVVAATLLPDSCLLIRDVNLNPTRTAFIHVLNGLGARIETQNTGRRFSEGFGDLKVSTSGLKGEAPATVLDGEIIANIVDEVPILAVAATQMKGCLEVRGARELRIKESDRIRTVVEGIRAMGGEIDEFEDGFAIEGPQRLRGGRVETGQDHRIAMAFTIAGLVAEGTTEIVDSDCAAVSFPEFYKLLEAVTPEGTLQHE
jgi:3-phosphoshikimate 1-carboxyvinyltransferase